MGESPRTHLTFLASLAKGVAIIPKCTIAVERRAKRFENGRFCARHIQRGRVVRVLDLKSGDPELKSHPDHQVDLFQVAPGSTARVRLYIANWSASWQLGFLTCWVYVNGLFHWPWKALMGRGQLSIYIHKYTHPVTCQEPTDRSAESAKFVKGKTIMFELPRSKLGRTHSYVPLAGWFIWTLF